MPLHIPSRWRRKRYQDQPSREPTPQQIHDRHNDHEEAEGPNSIPNHPAPPHTAVSGVNSPVSKDNPSLWFLPTKSDDPEMVKAQQAWQESLTRLDSAMAKSPALPSPNVECPDIKNALSKANTGTTHESSSDGFNLAMEQILVDQVTSDSELTGKAASFLPLKIVAKGLGQVIQLAISEDTRQSQILEELGRLSNHQQYVDSLREFQFLKPIISIKAVCLVTAVNEFLATSILYLKANYMKKVTTGVTGENKIDTGISALKGAVYDFDQAVQRETHFITWKAEEARRTSKVLDYFSILNYKVVQSGYRKFRAAGSGEWLLEQLTFKQWVDKDLHFLWCPGLPGAGKTILTSTIIDHLISVSKTAAKASSPIGLAYIYCDYKNQINQSVEAVLRSLIRQLVEFHPSLVTRLEGFLEGTTDTAVDAENYAELLTLIFGSFSRVYIVIDALDELSSLDGVRRSLVKILLSFTALEDMDCRLLITSRPSDDIEGMFSPESTISITPSTQDITSYVSMRVSVSEEFKAWCDEEPELLTQITNKIRTKSDGIFLLARFQMDSLVASESLGALEDAIEELTSNLDDYYDIAISRIKAIPEAGLAKTALALLSWICYAKQPLTVSEIQHALAVRPGVRNFAKFRRYMITSIAQVTGRCAGLLSIRDQGVIALTHETVQKYIFERRAELFPEAEKLIAQACITYLDLDSLDPGPSPSEKEFEERQKSLPFLRYTASFWADHSRGHLEEVLRQDILLLLKDNRKTDSMIQAQYSMQNLEALSSQNFPRGLTGLHIASSSNLLNVVQTLLKSGAAISPQAENGETPLYLAAEKCHKDVVKTLLEQGADPNIPGGVYGTALQAVSRGVHQDRDQVRRLLLEHNAAVDVGAAGGMGRIFELYPKAPSWLVAKLGEADRERRKNIRTQGKPSEMSGQLGSASDSINTEGEHYLREKLTEVHEPPIPRKLEGADYLETRRLQMGSLDFSDYEVSTLRIVRINSMSSLLNSGGECPICYCMLSESGRSGARRHIFGHLRPYICTFRYCSNSSFTTRREWLAHESIHWDRWICGRCEIVHSSSSLQTWAEHIIDCYKSVLDTASKRVAVTMTRGTCPLCDEVVQSDSIRSDQSISQPIPILSLTLGDTMTDSPEVPVYKNHMDRLGVAAEKNQRPIKRVSFAHVPPITESSLAAPVRKPLKSGDLQLLLGGYHKHIAKHQEEFADSAIPRTNEDSDSSLSASTRTRSNSAISDDLNFSDRGADEENNSEIL
ncbi:hypothetical protein VTL71DRAFT_13865 [Oculimacula yallundae]|uniref:NACHT domain-containing protein n=1 Tax=Oculimacula yallundae TaxID=86028 RepID=A0ABR4CLM0_9HELO